MMSNPFAVLGGGNTSGGMLGEFRQMAQAFRQFKANYTGNPKAEVENLLQTGQLNQQQLDQLQAMAQQFHSLLQ